jgi:hypothetical protein
MSLEALIAETNEELNAQSPQVQEFRQRLAMAMRTYPDLAAAVASIEELAAAQVRKRKLKENALAQWPTLAPAGRQKLMQPVQQELERRQRLEEAVEFVRNVLGFAPGPATGLFVVLFCAIWPLGCITGAITGAVLSRPHDHGTTWSQGIRQGRDREPSANEEGTGVCAFCSMPFAMLGVLLLFWVWRTRRIYRAWFQRYLIDRSLRENMPIADVVWAVRELECRPPGSPNARYLLKYVGMFERMVRRQFPDVKVDQT